MSLLYLVAFIFLFSLFIHSPYFLFFVLIVVGKAVKGGVAGDGAVGGGVLEVAVIVVSLS